MKCDDKESSGVVCAVARRAGAAAGTSCVVGKWIAGCGGRTVTVATDWIERPFKALMQARKGKRAAISGNGEPIPEQETARKKAAKALIAAAESAAVTVQPELKIAESKAEKSIAKAKSDASAMKEKYDKEIATVKAQADESIARAESAAQEAIAEAESQAEATAERWDKELAAVRAEVDEVVTKAESAADESVLELALKVEGAAAVAVEDRAELVVEPPAEQSVEEPIAEVQEQLSGATPDIEMPNLAKVTDAEAQAAVFPNPTDKIIFTKAFCEITSQDDTVRASAPKTIAAVRHELSVRVLVSQMACEPSEHVRHACVKALAAMNMKGALPAVEHALTDEAASVRLAAVWGMYHLAKAESASALIRMFADEDKEVRRRAATCFGWLGKEELAVELLPLLDDNSVSVRLAAVKAMRNLGSRKVVSSLIDQLNDPVESIRKAVLTAIETITGKKMNRSFPKDEKGFEILVARWQGWWKEELLG